MRLAGITADGFRNLEGYVPLAGELSVLVGENNAGKSNVIDACRILFMPEAGPRARHWITADDFAHDGQGNRLVGEFELAADLVELSDEERAQLVTCLCPSLGSDCARLRVRARLRADGKVDTDWFGGDSDHPDLERWAREAITFTYLHPLRDAAADLRPGRTNRLVELLASLAPEGHPDRAEVEKISLDANDALDDVETILDAKKRIQGRLDGMTGHGPLGQKSDLAFSDPQFERVLATLRAMAGLTHPLEISQNGLGYNNLLYMAVLLSALAERTDAALRILLVEEPEAHLHPQLQDLLMRHLEYESSQSKTQIVVTSHSPNFASAARVERVTVLSRQRGGQSARAPSSFGLSDRDLAHLHRFLDVTKAGLFFARGVIMVEGIAEQLLLPAIAERLGRPLSRDGIVVVNVGGVAFGPFAALFGPERLASQSVLISDSDPPPDGSAPMSATAVKLLEFENESLKVSLATRTLEWDLAAAGNWEVLIKALSVIKPQKGPALDAEFGQASSEQQADALLQAIKDCKGVFAQELAALLEGGEAFAVPDYLREAIEWVTEEQ